MKLVEIHGEKRHPGKAGFIPYVVEDGTVSFMFMVPSDPAYGGSKPAVSKGFIDEGENKQEAAIREAEEELGLKHSNLKPDTVKQVWEGEIEGLVEKYTMTIFAGEVKSRADFNKPHYETGSTHWLTAEEFQQHGRGSQRHIVQAAAKAVA